MEGERNLEMDLELLLEKAEQRRGELIALLRDLPPEKDEYGDYVAQQVCFFEELREAANERLLALTQWFELRKTRNPQCEVDFIAFNLIKAVYLCGEHLRAAVAVGIDALFCERDFESIYKSENHMLLFHTARLLYTQRMPEAVLAAYQKTGAQLYAEDLRYVKEFLVFRAKRGWAEFDTYGYTKVIIDCLLALRDFCADKALCRLAEQCLNLILLDMLADCSGPFYGGAHGRVYEHQILNQNLCGMFWVYYLYFGHDYVDRIENANVYDLLSSDFRPADYVYAAWSQKPAVYENFESKHLHSISSDLPHRQLPQAPGSINKYTYVTPDYVIGAVNLQDAYPEGSDAGWYAHHEQHEWDLMLTDAPDIRIFTHHPGCSGTEGKEHGQWTGDLGCGCGKFFCNRGRLIALYDIPQKEEKRIHAYVPRRFFEERQDGRYLFLHRGRVYISLWFSNGYESAEGENAGIEMNSYGARHCVVCEVATVEEYESFDRFIAAVREKEIAFDSDKMSAAYQELYIEGNERKIAGEPVQFPYHTYQCPFLYEAFNSGVVTVNGKTTIEFTSGAESV